MMIDIKDSIITILDGAGHSLEVVIGEGNLIYSEKREIKYTKNKGLLYDVKLGDQQPMEVSFDALWEYLLGTGVAPSIREALTQTGIAANWTSTDSDTCRPYCVDISIEHHMSCTAPTAEAEIVYLKYFRVEEMPHDLRVGTIKFSGKCNTVAASAGRFPRQLTVLEHVSPTDPSVAGVYDLIDFTSVGGIEHGVWQKAWISPRVTRVSGEHILYITHFLPNGQPDPEATTNLYDLDNTFGVAPFGDYVDAVDVEGPDVRIPNPYL
jgi:hypothetical protein